MRTSRTTQCFTILCASIILGPLAQAGPVVPAGLQPGDQYYLTFLTSDGRDATSTNIADYNSFVQAQAALNPVLTGTDVGVQWRAVASTESVDAIDNLSLQANTPIYLLDGTTEIASGGTQWWSGAHLAPINLTQFLTGDTYPFQVWTGTFIDGTASFPLGPSSSPHPTLGGDQSIIDAWVYDWPHAPVEGGAEAIRPLYAVSELITVVPEPATVWMMLIAGCALFGTAWHRRRKSVRIA
jgi:hypothetical protein